MILAVVATLAFLAGLGIGLVAASGVNYALTLRRQLKTAQKALEAREVWSPPTLAEVQARINAVSNDHQSDDAPRFSGIGPSDIASRELYEREKAKADKTPKFASPGVLNPDLSDIREAAREATNGGKPN